jgi:hypothetical protein
MLEREDNLKAEINRQNEKNIELTQTEIKLSEKIKDL